MLAFLRRAGLAAPGEHPAVVTLTGGVSSDIWRIDLRRGPVCVKRALPRLRVAQLWEAPVERNVFERRWMETANAAVPGIAPRIVAHDEAGIFAMQYLDEMSHPLWKSELRAGRADPDFARSVGERLARVHAATAGREDIARMFATDASFHAIRLEPYLLATARMHADVAPVLQQMVARTADTRVALVHGDVSPKNILCGPQGAVFLDAECAWYGDPAFDLAFCLNHLLLKCEWVPQHTGAFLASFDALARAYLPLVTWEEAATLESRAASLLPGLLLARIDGKSPVEYLQDEASKERVRKAARSMLLTPPAKLAEVRNRWQGS